MNLIKHVKLENENQMESYRQEKLIIMWPPGFEPGSSAWQASIRARHPEGLPVTHVHGLNTPSPELMDQIITGAHIQQPLFSSPVRGS